MQKRTHTSNGQRICSKCNEPKEPECYYKEKRVSDGRQSICITCCNANRKKPSKEDSNRWSKEWREKNPEKAKEIVKRHYKKNIEKNPNHYVDIYHKNKERIKETNKVWRDKNPKTEEQLSKNRIKCSEYREKEENRIKSAKYKQEWHLKNKERLNAKSNEYRETHKEERRIYLKEYNSRRRILAKQKRENDPLYRFKELLRAGVYRAFQSKGWGKTGNSAEILGCDFETAKAHIERQFTKGMSWDKIGSEIHIDHKIPISSAKNEEEVRHLCHYRNLQPLWKIDNLSKNDKIIPTQIHLPL